MKKIITRILCITGIFILSAMIYYLPNKNIATSLNNITLNSNAKTSYSISNVTANITTFNRYTIKYSSNVNIRGVITYRVNGKTEKERFFLEPSSSGTFSSFVSGYIDNVSIKKSDLISIDFENIDTTQGKITISSIELLSYPNVGDLINSINSSFSDSSYKNQKTIFIGNSNIKLGLSLKYGGSINYITGNSNIFSNNYANVNIINSADNGRLIQQCIYGNQIYPGNNERYLSGAEDNIDGAYNPIQGGNINHASKIVDIGVSADKKTIAIKTKPTLWRVTNSSYMNTFNDYYGGYTADAYMLTEYTVHDTYISVKNSYIDFTNNVNNTNNGLARSESPSVYTISALGDFYTYNMSTKQPVKQTIGPSINGFRNLNPDSNNNGQAMYSYWGGYFSTNSGITEGLGIYRPDYDGAYQYFHGFIAGSSNSKSSLDASTSFFTSIIHLNSNNRLKQFKKTSYDYVITLGNINNVSKIMHQYRDDHSYTLKVNPNGGSFNNTTSTTTLSPNLLAYWGNWHTIGAASRTGYTLDGYYTSQTGGTKVYDSTGLAVNSSYWKVTNHNLVEEKYQYIGNKDLTVYARWNPINYTISYNLDGGSATNPTSYNPTSSSITLNNPTKAGYTFAGWTGTGLSSATKTVTIPKGSTGNKTYKATWTKNKYTITYNANGGSISKTTQTVSYNSKIDTMPTPTRKGYTFLGWYTEKTNGKKIQTTTIYTYTNNITLYARWSDKETYTIKYESNGSTDKISSEKKELDSTYAPLPMPTRKGYTLLGWYTDKTKGTKIEETTKVSSNITLYARWQIINYTITYNLDNSIVNNKPTYNIETDTFTLNNPTKEGYVFDGWKDEKTGKITKTIKITKGTTGNKTYTAIFKKIGEPSTDSNITTKPNQNSPTPENGATPPPSSNPEINNQNTSQNEANSESVQENKKEEEKKENNFPIIVIAIIIIVIIPTILFMGRKKNNNIPQ